MICRKAVCSQTWYKLAMKDMTPPLPRTAPMTSAFALLSFACGIGMANPIPASAQTAAAPQSVTAGDVAGKPLDDLNLRKEKIAPVLEAAQANPYRIPGKGRCADLNREVADLNEALGPDIDESISPSAQQKRDRAIGGTARSVVGSLIPFGGVVREISGANAAENHRELYLYAGIVRRAFIKGYARARACRIAHYIPPVPDKK